MNKNIPQKRRVFPFIWPWKGNNNRKISLKELIFQKQFTIAYLIVIWLIVGILGFASTRDCESSWQLALQCEYAFWVKNITEAPLIFIRNLFTSLFLHNGLDHLLFVSVIGMILIVQSHEILFGSVKTALVFFSSYLIVAPFFAVFYTVGLEIFPDSHFMQFAFERNWMGGSIGMFQVLGSLATKSRKPSILLSIPVVFECFNLFVWGITSHISLMHLLSVFVGYGLTKRFLI